MLRARLSLALFVATVSVAALAEPTRVADPRPATDIGDAAPSPARPRAPAGSAPSRAAITKMIDRAAKQYGLERDLVHAVVRAESGYNPHAVSPAGAVGVMQVMPGTARDYGVGSGDALFDAQTNIRTGVRHLKRLVNKYGVGKAVMAYNAGEGALAKHNGFVTYGETQRYTHTVLSNYLRKKGISPYSDEAAKLTGVKLTPAMARAGGGGGKVARGKKGRGPLLRRVDVSKLSLRVRPTLSRSALDPSLHSVGPESKPMFVLEDRN